MTPLVTAGVSMTLGGIGAVSTAVEARGKGYMTKLLYHAIDEMRAKGYPASWLGGDRQRYNTFGWETATRALRLRFSRRSLDWYGVSPVSIVEVLPEEAIDQIAQWMPSQTCYANRPRLEALMRKVNMRVWLAEDGYAIAYGQDRDHVQLAELVSTSGNEAGLLRAIIEWNHGNNITWELSSWDEERLARVAPYVQYGNTGYSGLYRINDLAAVLKAALPALEHRAAALRDFAVALGIREHDRTQVTTITVEDGSVTIAPGRGTETYVELTPVTAVRLVFGGLPIPEVSKLPEGLLALLPVPVYVPPLDHV